MASITQKFLFFAIIALLSLLQHAAEAFFMPSFSSSYIKKSEPSAQLKPWQMAPSAALYYSHPYSLDQAPAPQTSVPVAVPVPVALHAPVPAPPPPQPPMQAAPPSQFASFGNGGLFHTMQLVPCLCSVPKEPTEPSAVVQEQRDQQNGSPNSPNSNTPRT